MSRARQSGFTLLELMVVIAVLAILSAVAAPSIATFISTQRLRNAAFDLVSDLLLARNEALNRQNNVVISPSSASGGEWSDGWTITSPSGTVTSRLGVPVVVRFVPADSSGNALASLTFAGTNGGRLATAATPVQITVKAADVDIGKWTCITLDATGRARAEKKSGGCT